MTTTTPAMKEISLANLLVPSKATRVDYPGMPGFEIDIAFLSRETLQKLRKKATRTIYKNRQPVDELDDDLFLELYVKNTIKGWSGLKLRYLEQLAPIDLGGADPDIELPYTEKDALALMKSSMNFDTFISEQVTDLGKFSENKLA